MFKNVVFCLLAFFLCRAERAQAQGDGGMCLNCFLVGPPQQADAWLPFVTLSYRGVQAHSGDFADKLGFDLGISAPFFRGIDLALGFGEMFKEGGLLHQDVRTRIYFGSMRHGFYIGGGQFYEPAKSGYATLGFGGRDCYLEVDITRGTRRPLTAIGEFGFRIFFD